jgi:hypothetical protein
MEDMRHPLGELSVLILIAGVATGCRGRDDDRRDPPPDGSVPRPDGSPPGDCPGDGWCRSREMVPGNLVDVWASSPEDVWAITSGSEVWRYDGSAWRDVDAPFEIGMQSIWGTAPDDVWAGGELAVIWHWDGAAWMRETIAGPTTAAVVSFARASDGTMWALGRNAEILRRDPDG